MHDRPFDISAYVVDGQLGRGAASWVYRIRHRKTQDCSALKVIFIKNQDQTTLKNKLKHERDIHSTLSHPRVVTLLNYHEDEEALYYHLELCPGGDLQEYLRQRGHLSPEDLKDKAYQILEGIAYLHSQQVIHRDLKLANILLGAQGEVKLADLGLATRLEGQEECFTFCGTRNYISPEIIDRRPYGFKADSWSFGCILFTLATGRPPFDGLPAKDFLQIIQNTDQLLQDPLLTDPVLKDLISGLICHDQSTRLSIQQALLHPFFKDKHQPITLYQNCNNNVQIINQYTIVKKDNKNKDKIKSASKSDRPPLKKNMVKSKSKDHFWADRALSPPPKKTLRKNRSGVALEGLLEKSRGTPPTPTLDPIECQDLKPDQIDTKNGNITIHQDHSIQFIMQQKGLVLLITENGQQISMSRGGITRTYPLCSLPQKYHCYYSYVQQVINTLRPRQVLQQIDNHVGRFTLRKHAFSATFHDGYQISHRIQSNTFQFTNKVGQQYDIQLDRPLDLLHRKYQKIVKICTSMLRQMLHQEWQVP